jgi:hypothetical protein
MATQSYWEQRTFRSFETSVESRLAVDAEERDAVLSVLWRVLPTTAVMQHRVMVVPIPARAWPTSALLYRFTFDPPANSGRRARVRIERVSSGEASTPREAPAAPGTYVPGRPGMTFSGFPRAAGTDDADAYFASHPSEHCALFHWLETEAPPSFDQVVTTSARSSATHCSVFHVTGDRDGGTGTLRSLRLDLVSEGSVEPPEPVPPDYRSHDVGDLELEELQAQAVAFDRLGPVTIDRSVPPGELISVKEAIRQYFEVGHARDTDVHAIVPFGARSSALYELSFGANNGVIVTRIGDVGAGPGQVDVQRLDVTRVNGFPGKMAAAALGNWWRQRYAGGGAIEDAPPDESAATWVARMDRHLSAGVASPDWFARNYGIAVLDAAATAARLVATHGVPRELTLDALEFDATDRLMLELSLETLSDGELWHLRGIEVGRKSSSIAWTAAGYRAGGPAQCGATLTATTGADLQTTVLYFGSLYQNNAALFRGGTAARALPDVVMTMLHELGHAISERAGLGAAFHAWVRLHPQTPPTWYAARAPATELFPEAFALYHTEPAFLLRQDPLLYAWLDELARAGRPPHLLDEASAGGQG